jgi:adenylate kinase family enzyme
METDGTVALAVTRILIVGPTGAGKTSTAKTLARRSGLPNVELDRLVLGPEWTQLPDEDARRRVAAVVTEESWLINGNYAAVRDIVWRRAQLVVWLDLPKRTVFRRLLWRTGQRLVQRKNLDSGNKETLGRLLGRQSILLWAARSHQPLRAEYERALELYGDHVHIVRLRSASAQRDWLASTRAATAAELPVGVEHALVCPLARS